MSQFRLTIERNKLPELGRRTRYKLHRAIHKLTVDVQAEAQRLVQSPPKTGRVYERGEHMVAFFTKDLKLALFVANKGKKSRQHQASAPGEAPATDTGNLVNSISARMLADHLGEVSVGAEYGVHLEFGTKRMAARPFLGPAVETVRPVFPKIIAQVVREAADE